MSDFPKVNDFPKAGDLFYADSKIWRTIKGQFGEIHQDKDRSYASVILRAVAVDSNAVVASITWGGAYGDEKRALLLRTDYSFYPVGEDVAMELGLL